ncbi:MAG: ABC transporter permease [Candidatus Omnitrophica bacterium]|nr:ABC transporter permease [Candidatus Omnitrophota bacterium]
MTLSIVALGLATLIISNALYDGFHEKMVTNAVRVFMGHIQIHAHGFQANPTVENCFLPLPDRLVQQAPGKPSFAKRVRFQALASTSSNSVGAMVTGVEPEAEAKITLTAKCIVEGRYLTSQANDFRNCLVGEQLAKNLHLHLGEKLIIMAQAFDGSLVAEAFQVIGICRTGNPEMDRSFVWIPLKMAQDFLAYGENISEIVLLAEDSSLVTAIRDYLLEHIDSATLEVLTWKEIAPDIVQMIELDLAMQRILMLIISVIAAMAIMNTMLMAIQERYPEFGVLLAMGSTPAQLVTMVLGEAFCIGLLGLVAGLTLTAIASTYFFSHGVNLSSFAAGVAKFIGFDTIVKPLIRLEQVAWSCLTVLSASVVASVLPAIRAARMDPIQAIRHI